MSATILSSPSLALWKALEAAGFDANRVFDSAGFDPALLSQPGVRVPVSVIRGLWLRALDVTGNPSIALKRP